MAKAAKKKAPKKRADKYEEKVSFDGSFEDMIGISVKDADKRMKEKNKKMEDRFYFEVKLFIHLTDPNGVPLPITTETHYAEGDSTDPHIGIEKLKRSIKTSYAQNDKYKGYKVAVTAVPAGTTRITKEMYEKATSK